MKSLAPICNIYALSIYLLESYALLSIEFFHNIHLFQLLTSTTDINTLRPAPTVKVVEMITAVWIWLRV